MVLLYRMDIQYPIVKHASSGNAKKQRFTPTKDQEQL